MAARRISLRTRLIALVVAVAAVALIAVDVVIPLTVRSALMTSKEQMLAASVANLKTLGSGPLSQQLDAVSPDTPIGGQLGWTIGFRNGTSKVVQAVASDPVANPEVGWATATDFPVVVRDVDRPEYRYLALGVHSTVRLVGQGEVAPANVVAWVPLADVEQALGRVILLEILISLGLLVVVGGVAGFVARRELRSLEVMAHTADEIAAGDLSRRVDGTDSGSEVGQLGTAFNGMVDAVTDLLAQRAAAERRMRQFMADASHELRTPLAAVRGYAELYQAGALPQGSDVDRAVGRIGFETERMSALVEDLLTLTQSDEAVIADADAIDMSQLLIDVVDDAAVIDPERTWRLAGTGAHAVVLGDRLRLHQLFANLLANIRTHTPPGTTATVALHAGESVVQVAVIDDGPGVPDDDLPLIFDRFYRADKARSRERGGSGLGLSIVAAIVRAHGGHITATAASGGGLTVTVTLPTSDR